MKQVNNESSLITLTPNIFLKDFQNLSGDCQIASISLNCLAQICDSELSLTLYQELFPLFTCSKPTIRKKACGICYKIFLKSNNNEHIIEEIKPYLADRLKDSNLSVKMAAISTIYEMTKINSDLFIVTIPVVYQLLCETSNNWILIKLIKLLTEFCEAEPRLKIKLKPKFLQLLQS